MTPTLRSITLLACLLVGTLAVVGQNALTIRDTTLRDAPFNDANVVGKVSANSAVKINKRKGGWYQIKADAGKGWVRMTSLRLDRFGHRGNKGKGKANKNKAAAGLGQAVGRGESLGDLLTSSLFSTGRGKSDQVSAATGIGGLSEAQLKDAEPDPEAVEKLDSYAVSDETAQLFADKVGLLSQKLDYFEAGATTGKDKSWFNPDQSDNSPAEEEDSP